MAILSTLGPCRAEQVVRRSGERVLLFIVVKATFRFRPEGTAELVEAAPIEPGELGPSARLAEPTSDLHGVRAVGRAYGLVPGDPSGPLELHPEVVGQDAGGVTVVWRAELPVTDERVAASLHVLVGVELPGQPLTLPAARPAPGFVHAIDATLPLGAPPAPEQVESTLLVGSGATGRPATPFDHLRHADRLEPTKAVDIPGAPWAHQLGKAVPQISERDAVEGTLLLATAEPTAAALSELGPRAEVRSSDIPVRSRERIPVYADRGLSVMTCAWQLRPPTNAIAIAVKATCDLLPGDDATLRADANLLTGDLFAGDDPGASLRYPSDFVVLKPRADLVVHGHAYAPHGRTTAMEVGLRFGELARRVAVFGDRRWGRHRASEPVPFERMPLVWERAMGGPDHPLNPVGRGIDADGAGVRWLPNLEDPAHLLTSPGDRRTPVCFGAVSPFWPARRTGLGTHDEAWLRSRWPFAPQDFDWRSMQAAPPGQQLEHIAGDERFELLGMHPHHPRLTGRLPRRQARCFVQGTASSGGVFYEVILRLDTVVIDADALTIDMLWRGAIEVGAEHAPEIAALFAMLEPLSTRTDLPAARDRFLAQVSLASAPLLTDEPDAPLRIANDTVAEPTEQTEAVAAAEALVDAARARLRAAGLPDLDDDVRPEPPPAPLDPSELAELRARLEAAEVEPEVIDEALRALAQPAPELPDEPPQPSKRELVLRRLRDGEPLCDLDLSGADLRGLDLRGQSLDRSILVEAQLSRTNLVGASLCGAQLGSADLTDATLDGANLSHADLHGAVLHEASLTGAEVTGAGLSRVSATAADLSGVHGAQPVFDGSVLDRALFRGARLDKASFIDTQLDGARFDEAQLPGARFHGARGQQVSFAGATLEMAGADGALFPGARFDGVRAPRSVWDDAVLDRASFAGADLRQAGFMRASARQAVFAGAELRQARFRRATLPGASFLKANLMMASFEAAELSEADLRGSNLFGAELWKADLRGTQRSGAIVAATKLEAS